MKYVMILLVVFLFVNSTIAGNNDEFRAFWVVTWAHINSTFTVNQNKARVRQILDNVKKANMNAILWQVRQSGTAYYNSSYEPWGRYAGYEYPGYDPLAYAIEEAHKRGLELHAWFNTFQVSEENSTLDPLPPALQHPDWVCRDIADNPMPQKKAFSPGMASVRNYTVDVAMEIVNNYDIDGLHLDYVRWNEYTTSSIITKTSYQEDKYEFPDGIISKEQLNLIAADTTNRYLWDIEHPGGGLSPDGFDGWSDWWRWSVTEYVKSLHDSIQTVKPWVRLSAAALGKYNWSSWNGYGIVYQDAALWFNKGYVDQLTPMHYHWLNAESFYGMLEGDCNISQCWKDPCQEGINDKRLYTVGPASWLLDENGIWDNHVSIVEKARNVSWTDGFQFYRYEFWENNNYWLEAKAKMFPTVTKVRDTGLIDDTAPQPPLLSVTKLDSLKYYIVVNPPAGTTEDHWFALYRSTGETVDQDEDQIIYRRFGTSNFTYTDTFSDIQEYSPHYYYAATMLDRYWNESTNSNIFKTDSIPEISPIETPPLTPDHVRVLNHNISTLKVLCDPAERAAQYVAMISLDGITFSDSVVADTNEIFITGLDENRIYYLKVKAKNSGGSSLHTKRLFAGVSSSDPHEVLIVNGFDRGTNTRYDYIRFYADPLNERGYPFSYTMNETVIAGKVSLQDFSTVIWILGDESTADHTFDPMEQAKVKAFLDGGGHFFVSGAEIGWDLEYRGGFPDVEFYRNYLKANYISDAPKGESGIYYFARELERGIFEGLGDIQFDDGTHGTIDVDWPDAIWAAGGAGNVLKFKDIESIDTQGVSGIAFEGNFPNGSIPGKLVYLSFPFETIVVAQKRMDVMDRIFDFFEGKRPVLPIQAGNVIVAEEFFLHQNYPNPFNPLTTIKFSLKEPNPTTLIIYDILGQAVTTLVEEKLVPGQYSVQFDGRNLASGTYLYILRSGAQMMKRKMVLIK